MLLIVVLVTTVGVMVTVVTFMSVTCDVTLLVAEVFMKVTFISVEPTLVSVDVLKIIDVLEEGETYDVFRLEVMKVLVVAVLEIGVEVDADDI